MIATSFIVAFIVLFIHATFWEGMIFSFISEKLKNLPEYIKKPLYDCPICQSPWWGSLIIFVGNTAGVWQVDNLVKWVFILFSAGGLNTIFIYIINQGKIISKTLDEYECDCTKKEDKDINRKERIKRVGEKYKRK